MMLAGNFRNLAIADCSLRVSYNPGAKRNNRGFFYSKRPQPIEKIDSEKINASKRQLFY